MLHRLLPNYPETNEISLKGHRTWIEKLTWRNLGVCTKRVRSSIIAQSLFPGSECHSLYWVILVSQPRAFNRNIKESLVSPHPSYLTCTDTGVARLFIFLLSFIHQSIVIPSKDLQAARYRDFQGHQHFLGSRHRQIVASLILDPLELLILLALYSLPRPQ